MTLVKLRIAMSLDGYSAGPRQSVDNPLGVGGMRLHEWVFPLAAWRAPHGMEGGIVDESTPVVEQVFANLGATIMGRNMFGGHPGPWSETEPWNGWWGDDPPYHHPVFVLTHYARAPLALGDTTFHFVTDGIESALEQARRAAGASDVAIAGGANVAQQYLRAGLVDEMLLHIAPTVLGGGEALFAGLDDLGGLALDHTVAAPNVTHLRFVRR